MHKGYKGKQNLKMPGMRLKKTGRAALAFLLNLGFLFQLCLLLTAGEMACFQIGPCNALFPPKNVHFLICKQ